MSARRHKSRKARLDRVITHFTLIVINAVVVLSSCGPAPNASPDLASNPSKPDNSVDLSPDQLKAIKIEPVGTSQFAIEKVGVGSIDFDNKLYFDNNLSRQVFPPQPGKIINTLAELGDQVQKGQPLYTISSPKQPELAVRSPITGQVTSVNASPGLQVEPGKAPAPYAVADVSTKWMIGNVPESDSTFFRVEQPVEVRVATYPGFASTSILSPRLSAVKPCQNHFCASDGSEFWRRNAVAPSSLAGQVGGAMAFEASLTCDMAAVSALRSTPAPRQRHKG